MRTKTYKILALIAVLILGSFASNAQQSRVWSFSGDSGPQNWAELSSAFRGCETGNLQSPIDVTGSEAAVLHPLRFFYKVTPINLRHDGYQITLRYQAGSKLHVGDRSFVLEGVSFRSPAEHTIDGKAFPMALQFHHEDDDGTRAIVSVMVREGTENTALREIVPYLPLEPGQNNRMDSVLTNARDLVPNTGGFFRYNGSMTVPPCSEGVNWYIMKTPITFSREQISSIKGLLGEQVRPVQPRNYRIILDTIE